MNAILLDYCALVEWNVHSAMKEVRAASSVRCAQVVPQLSHSSILVAFTNVTVMPTSEAVGQSFSLCS